MSGYIICYDPKRNVSIRTTSSDLVAKLKELEPSIMEIAWVSGRDCNISDSADMPNHNVKDYKKVFAGGCINEDR